jgi:uncharacterized membrane protein YhhN
MIPLLAIATMVGCFGYLAAEYLERRLAGCLLKTFASSAFVALAAFAGAADTTFGQVLFAGFVLSLIGDVLLLWHATFLAGLGSFLLGHVAFALGAVTFLTKPGALAAAAPTLAVGALLMAVAATLAWRFMRRAVLAYLLTIATMVVLTIGAAAAGAPLLLPVGAILFAISDLAVARERFVEKTIRNKVWGLPFYYGAQVLIALSIEAASRG